MRICIVKLSAMGDIIHAMVALQFIKKALPHAKIDWVVEEAFRGVLENNLDIENVLCVNLKSLRKKKRALFSQYRLLKSYSKNHYDLIIDAQGLLKSALVAKIIGAKEIAGFDKDSIREGIASFFYTKKVSIAYSENTIDRNVRVLCEPLGIEVPREAIVAKKPFLFSKSVVADLPERFLVFVIGSTWKSRNYPKEKFVEIAQALEMKTLVVWGSEEEHRKALWMQEKSAFIEVLPRGSLDALKQVISKCTLLIGNDTGPTHMAWALNVPSITIFGPTPINRVYITPINKVVKSKSSVNPLKLNKHDFSIQEIASEEIIKVARTLLS
ncbi:lipopolysaccharide heptosyltransferase I [Sulfurospirillum barnesii]|uniref:Lipopolysaccharide heptosyltransferase 1 n=1 Tax=Sulfurospirillum barnesii (strain ATCC 700032 / DSM 10660 / SES-3) TaxID=760154 RepID=I3XZ08_SULBS|nr:lipopolysaccharide heptosyltransferase I [Sulfurospirillum barnesii]AFL69182.1 lipopolysaccharide heptosyltransferase I [Sulfurospirillum barnesii SES-3]